MKDSELISAFLISASVLTDAANNLAKAGTDLSKVFPAQKRDLDDLLAERRKLLNELKLIDSLIANYK